jgi:hypothetical protein
VCCTTRPLFAVAYGQQSATAAPFLAKVDKIASLTKFGITYHPQSLDLTRYKQVLKALNAVSIEADDFGTFVKCKKMPRVLRLDNGLHHGQGGEDFDIDPDVGGELWIDLSKAKGVKEIYLDFVGSHGLHKLPEGLEVLVTQGLFPVRTALVNS